MNNKKLEVLKVARIIAWMIKDMKIIDSIKKINWNKMKPTSVSLFIGIESAKINRKELLEN